MADPLFIQQVIADHFGRSPGLKAALPGGLVPGRSRPDTPTVRGTFDVVSAVPGWTTELVYTEPTRVQFTLFGPTAHAAALAARALCVTDPEGFDRLRDVPLGDGTMVTAQRVNGPIGPLLDESEGAAGSRAWFATVDYLFHLTRTL